MATKKTPKPPAKKPTATEEKRTYFNQSDFPRETLQQAMRIASALIDNFAGRDGSPPDIALAIGVSPTSSNWPVLAGELDCIRSDGGRRERGRNQAASARAPARCTRA